MKPPVRALSLFALVLMAGFARPVGVTDTALPGRFPSPSLDSAGRLAFLYLDAAGALRLGTGDSAGEGSLLRGAAASRIPLFPRLKEDRAGARWAVWVEGDGLLSEVLLGRVGDDGPVPADPIGASSGMKSLPDLDFDQSNRPWIAWAHESDGLYGIRVREPVTGRVDGVGTANAGPISGLRILSDGSSGPWVFWVGRGLGRDEIFFSRFDGTAWSPAGRLNRDERIPHLFLEAVTDPAGRPWVVWAAFDGRVYRIFGSRWDGRSWTAEEALTAGAGSEAFPALTFAGGTEPILVWARTSGPKCALWARPLDGAPAGREAELIPITGGSIRGLGLAGRSGALAVLWESADGIRSRRFSRDEIIAKTAEAGTAASLRLVSAAVTDENEYISFGDDITAGVIDGSPAPDLGYVPRLEALIRANFGTGTVFGEGIIGESTIGGLGRIGDVLAARGARYFFLMEGTNDVVVPGISTDATAFNIEQMIRLCLEAQTLPVLGTIIPRNDNFWNQLQFRRRLYAINDAVEQIAINQKIAMVDTFSAFMDFPVADGGWTSLLPDGVHPNELGYAVIARAWAEGILDLPFPPSELAVRRTTERSLVMSRSLNYLTWSPSGKISDPFKFQSYRIYRRDLDDPASVYELVASVAFSPFHDPQKFNDLDIVAARRYEYVVTLLRIDGIEGPASDPAAESD